MLMNIRNVIFHHYEEQDSLTKNGAYYRKTIPKDLFCYICKEHEILPFQQEICAMLISMLIISSTLFLALATIDGFFRRRVRCLAFGVGRCSIAERKNSRFNPERVNQKGDF